MKKLILFISALILFICVSSFGMAFDDHRRGFIIGGLGGIALVTWRDIEDDVEVNNGTDFSIHTDFRMGGGFKGDQFMLYFWGIGNWVVMERVYWDKGIPLWLIPGVGMSYYFRPTSPSLYINAGIGIFPSLMGGIGYEFAPHWSLEAGIMYLFDYDVWGFRRGFNAFAIALSIVGIAY